MPMTESTFTELKTARQIASCAGVPLHRVDYAVQRLRVAETARVGIVRLFGPAEVSRILRALREIAARRSQLSGLKEGVE